MKKSMLEFLKTWKNCQEIELSVFCGEQSIAHFEFAIFNRRQKKQEFWQIHTLNGDAEFFLREPMEVQVYAFRDRRPNVIVSLPSLLQ